MTTQRPLANSQAKKMEQSIKAIQNSIEEGSKKIIPTKKAVIVLGDTGEGKSALINYIAGNPLIAKYNKFFKSYFVEAQKKLEDVQIGHGPSKTHIPGKWIDKDGTVYWDCPGFNDTKSSERDIANGFFIKRIFDKSNQIKILIVVSEMSIMNRAKEFLGVLKKLENLFVDFEKIITSICLILTQTVIESPHQFKEYGQTVFLQDHSESLTQKQNLLLNNLFSDKGHIALISKPLKDGPIDMSGNQAIKNTINLVQYSKRPHIQITVSNESLVLLQHFGTTINTNIRNSCLKLNECLKNLCFTVIQYGNSYDLIKSQLIRIKDFVKEIKETKELRDFVTNCQKIINELKISFKQQLITKQIDFLEFIRQVKSETTANLQNWKSQLNISEIIDQLVLVQQLQQPNFSTMKNNETINIIAGLIGVNTIQQIIQKRGKNNLKFINLFCHHTFFIDSDLIAPGINLSVISQNWKIVGDRKISLKGLDAKNYSGPAKTQNYQDQQGNGMNGYDGLPGRAGQTGGNFFGKIMSKNGSFGPGKLFVDLRGGNGGNGQDGGDGGKGSDGKKADSGSILNRQQSALVCRQQYNWSKKEISQKINQCWKTLLTFNGQMLQTYRAVGQKGKIGGNGGKKGAKGLGGHSGQIKFEEVQVKVQKGNGNDGKEGKSGHAGEGGRNGSNFERQYINQSIFPAFRQAGKVIEQKETKQTADNNNILVPTAVGSGAGGCVTGVMLVSVQSAKQIAMQGAKKTASIATQQALKQTGKQMGQTVSKYTLQQIYKKGFLKATEELVTNIGKDYALTSGKLATIQAAKQGSIQEAEQAATQGTMSALIGGAASLGLSLTIQTGVSAISAGISSKWKDDGKWICNGFAPSGKTFSQANCTGQQIPCQPFKINDIYISHLMQSFSDQKKVFFQGLP